jgi:phosphatidylserine/phosphatidylglycerophosphate/cardiolipin synthase-like enzyme
MIQSPAFRQYLLNKQNAVDAEKLHELKNDRLFNEKTFYPAFVKDMLAAKNEVIIYCPFITKFRAEFFRGTLRKLKDRNVSVFIFTRPLEEHDYLSRSEISCALSDYEELGVSIISLPGSIHAKVAIIDREILWEGSLNILSQRTSQEIMKRIADKNSAMQIMTYLCLNKKMIESYKLKYERLCQSLKAGVKHDFKLKVLILVVGIVIAVTARWLFVILKAMMLLLKGIMDLIYFICKK